MGAWRLHLSFNKLIDLADTDTKVFAASESGIIVLDKPSSELTTISKIDGLGGGEDTTTGLRGGGDEAAGGLVIGGEATGVSG